MLHQVRKKSIPMESVPAGSCILVVLGQDINPEDGLSTANE